MTYGWAILVVLAAIGALAYFGVLSPDRFLPSNCTIQGAFSCDDWKADGSNNQIRFKVINSGLGADATDVNVTLDTDDCTFNSSNPLVLGSVDNRDNPQVTFQCSNDLDGVIDGDITVAYREVGDEESHTATGSLTLRVE